MDSRIVEFGDVGKRQICAYKYLIRLVRQDEMKRFADEPLCANCGHPIEETANHKWIHQETSSADFDSPCRCSCKHPKSAIAYEARATAISEVRGWLSITGGYEFAVVLKAFDKKFPSVESGVRRGAKTPLEVKP